MNSTHGYWFESSLFQVEAGEDEETNPGLFGRQLALWLRQQFSSLGYDVEDPIAEDWGWCVMCQRNPYRMWIGCVNLTDHQRGRPVDPPLSPERLLWNVVPMAEVPFFKYLFKKKPDTQPGLDKLDDQLRRILESESGIVLVDDAVADAWFAA